MLVKLLEKITSEKRWRKKWFLEEGRRDESARTFLSYEM
jgi:hypothetical protein